MNISELEEKCWGCNGEGQVTMPIQASRRTYKTICVRCRGYGKINTSKGNDFVNFLKRNFPQLEKEPGVNDQP